MKHELPKLPYAYDALEPYIDAQTMEIHHTKHHQTYVDKLNAALEEAKTDYPELSDMPIDDLLKSNGEYLEKKKNEREDTGTADFGTYPWAAIQRMGGGHANHSLFWNILGPTKEIDEQLTEEIKKEFTTVQRFKETFTDTAVTIFGSGWAWLIRDEKGKLQVTGTPNQDSPIQWGQVPLIGLDLWEHAYYLKYQNRRPEYIENWWKVLKVIE